MTSSGQRHSALALTIGVVGPHDLVERIMLSGAAVPGTHSAAPGTTGPGVPSSPTAGPGVARRLIGAAYRNEQEAADKVLRLGPGVDAWLFASQVPYSYARRAGVLRGPATCVPLNGSALCAALLRASRSGNYDLSKVSVDILSRGDVTDVFADLGIATSDVHVREEPANAARSEEHTSELQSQFHLVCRLLLE